MDRTLSFRRAARLGSRGCRSSPKSKLIPALLAVAALLALPAAAQRDARLHHQRLQPARLRSPRTTTARGRRRSAPGPAPKVSPDGELVVFEREDGNGKAPGNEALRRRHRQDEDDLLALARKLFLRLVPGFDHGGGAARRRTRQAHPLRGRRRNRQATRIATGYFNGVSFSPDCKEVVFGLAGRRTAYPPKTDIVRAPVDRRPDLAADPRRHLRLPALGPDRADRLRQAAGREAAPVRRRRTTSS